MSTIIVQLINAGVAAMKKLQAFLHTRMPGLVERKKKKIRVGKAVYSAISLYRFRTADDYL